ncbi:MAG: cobalamin biosynthesis protein [Shewanella sp.]|nr:cobalamin biosynthesis protein [Shewanella sp.]MCF1429902.1 cobalamin biosynthesis protein [Shewanella sp.]MCF1440078.1 cobalamin biosynthesis protein [Shewanella sp.]MCF1457774.1 cobalamin biosynthesis protein [Shewanella sp.]
MDTSLLSSLPAKDAGILELFALMTAALLLSRIRPLPLSYDPFHWLAQLADQLAQKAAHPERSNTQQYTAGTLGALLLVLPFWCIVVFIPLLAAYPWFFELVMLYICFNDNGINRLCNKVADNLERDDKASARALLTDWVPQSVSQLSATGLSKTAIELVLNRPAVNLTGVSLAFFTGGPALAILLRMLTSIAAQWPTQSPTGCFGRPVNLLSTLLMWLPDTLWALLLALQGGPTTLTTWLKPRSAFLSRSLTTGSQALAIELGGPQMFGNIKVSRAKTASTSLPDSQDIRRAILLSRTAAGYYSVLLICLPLLWILIRLYAH